jgi:hypothetical protein
VKCFTLDTRNLPYFSSGLFTRLNSRFIQEGARLESFERGFIRPPPFFRHCPACPGSPFFFGQKNCIARMKKRAMTEFSVFQVQAVSL